MAFKSFFIIAISLFQFGYCRIFNESDYPNFLKVQREQGIDELQNELTPEQLAMYRFDFVFPGTKWCGPGDTANNDDELGSAWEADNCCRDHDHCDEVIKSKETMYNLTNRSFYSRLSCDCDEKFRVCLRSANTKTASVVGYSYFNVIGTQCFRKDFKITGCKKYSGLVKTKCIEYDYDMNSEKVYQWFDVPNYNDDI